MATIINNPGESSGGTDSAAGMIIGIVIAIILIALFVIYGLPALRQNSTDPNANQPDTTNVNVSIPNPVSSTAPASY